MRVLLVVFVILCAPLGGCFGERDDVIVPSSLEVGPDYLVSGVFQEIRLTAETDLSVLVPYLVMDPESGLIQNSTVLDMGRGEQRDLEILTPPRLSLIHI